MTNVKFFLQKSVKCQGQKIKYTYKILSTEHFYDLERNEPKELVRNESKFNP